MEKAYKFRIYPNKKQEEIIQKTFGCVRFVYNYYLNEQNNVYDKEKRRLSRYECSNNLTQLKKDIVWLKEVDSTALQSSLQDLDMAFQNFFRRTKKGENPEYPKFKSKRNKKRTYKSKMNITLLEGQIRLPKLGLVKCRVSKKIEGRILSATVSQNKSGEYYVSVCCTDVEVIPFIKTGSIAGIDLGLKELAVISDGHRFQNHKYLDKSYEKLAKAHRRLSRKSSGGKNYEKARIKVAKMYRYISNQRRDSTHKMTTDLVKDYDLIVIETLFPKNMVKNRKLAKAISDAAWGEIVRQLNYKCKWYGKELVKVDRFYPSSQTCSHCGFKNINVKNLAVREWKCPQCGIYHDRDLNAAKNILNEGLRIRDAA